jgi:hypothetical protein
MLLSGTTLIMHKYYLKALPCISCMNEIGRVEEREEE